MIFYGRNVVLEALKSSVYISAVYLQDNITKDEKISAILNLAKKRKLQLRYINSKELKKLTGNEEHQGCAINATLELAKPSAIDFTALDANYIYIYDVTYEHNLGAIIRTCESAGISGVIVPKEVNITPVVAKASAGALFHTKIFKESIFNILKVFAKNNCKIISIERGGINYTTADLTGSSLFIIGGEDKSISDKIIEKSDILVSIPQFGEVNSLNMSVAASIVLYEKVRQEGIK